jgi:hypothetical protein
MNSSSLATAVTLSQLYTAMDKPRVSKILGVQLAVKMVREV